MTPLKPNGKPRILIVSTGGTITMVRGNDGGLAPCSDAGMLLNKVPELRQLAEIEVLPLVNLDSTNLQPAFWLDLAKAIYQRLDSCDGVVITHGTDTLCYTASALAFMLQELPKPVVMTGSQVPLDEIGSDGRANLINAVRVACGDVAEVLVVFGALVIRATRAKKTSAFDMQAFTSVNAPPVGTIGLTIRMDDGLRMRGKRRALLRAFLNPNVAMLPVYPGLKPEVVSHLVSTHAGLVLEGYGAGHIPNAEGASLVPAIAEATARRVPVVVCTQCLVGSTEMELYQVGRSALLAGAIPAMDMTPEAALVKLMWVLGQADDPATVGSLMQKAFAGELHEIA